MKKFIIILALSTTLLGCQQNMDKGEAANQKGEENDAVVVNSSNQYKKNDLNEITVFGGNTFDPELQLEVKDDGFFDTNTDLSIIEEGENVFVLWKSGDDFLNGSRFYGSIATNGKWVVTNKEIYTNKDYSFWEQNGTYILTMKDIGKWSERQNQISIRRIESDGTLSNEIILATVPTVDTLSIIPTSQGKVVIYSGDDRANTKDTTYYILPIEGQSIDKKSITVKRFPEGGIYTPNYIDFMNKKIYGLGKRTKGLLQISMVSGEPLYDDYGNEKFVEVGELVNIDSNKKGQIEVFWNDKTNLYKKIINKNFNIVSEEVVGSRNKHITIKDDLLHYWEVILYKNRPSLNLKEIKL
jgi:hypothetical protein